MAPGRQQSFIFINIAPKDVTTTEDIEKALNQRPRGKVAMVASGREGMRTRQWHDPAREVREVPSRILEVVVTIRQ